MHSFVPQIFIKIFICQGQALIENKSESAHSSLQSSKEAGSKIQQLECGVLNAAVQNQQAPNRDTYV